MVRWQPDTSARLQAAALELYAEHGYEQTTVAEIAARAGLTERTFFRYFADKREVLFSGSEQLGLAMVAAVSGAPASASPMDAVVDGVGAVAAEFFADRYEHASRRQAVIDANTSLQERELIKMATLARDLAGALGARGVPEPAASITAEAGVLVFRVAFERWIAAGGARTMADLVADTAAGLRAATA